MLLIVALLGGWAGWKIYAIISAKPGPLIDYTPQLIALSEKYQPEGENGWPALMKALEHFDNIGVPDVEGWPTDDEGEKLPPDVMRICEGPFDAGQVAIEISYLKHVEQAGVWEELQRALASPRFVRTEPVPPDTGVYFLNLPELGAIVQLGRTRCAAMRVAAATGDRQGFIDAVRDQLGLAVAISFAPASTSELASMAIQCNLFGELHQELVEYAFDESVCEQVLKLFESTAKVAPQEYSLEIQRLWFQDLVNRTYSDDGRGDGLVLIREVEWYLTTTAWSSKFGSVDNSLSNLFGLGYATRSETLDAIDTVFDAAARQSRMTRTEREVDPFNLADIRRELPEDQLILRRRTPDLARQMSTRLATRSGMVALRLLIAIELHEARHGGPPKALDDLVPECLAEVPIDPVSDCPYGYRRRQPDQQDPRSFWLYSLGADRTDNDGRELSGALGTPIQSLHTDRFQVGYDYIFNRLREPVEEER